MRTIVAGMPRNAGPTFGIVAGLTFVGIGAEVVGGAADSVADLAVGLAVGIAGAIVIGQRRRDLVGRLLVAAALLWFAGTLASASGVAGRIGRELQFAHRGALLLAVVVPVFAVAERATRRSKLAMGCGLVVGAGASSLGPGATSAALLVVVGGITIVIAVRGLVRSPIGARRAMWAAGLLATAVWVLAAAASRKGTVDPQTTLRTYQLGVSCAALALAAHRRVLGDAVDQVVGVGRASDLGGALGDTSLRVGFEDADGVFRSVGGSPVVPSGSQASTEFDLGTEGRARVVHQRGLLDDDRVRHDVEVAARLLAAHHRLTGDVQAAAARVSASRTRLIRAEDDASMAFGQELARRVLPHLDEVSAALDFGGTIDTAALDLAAVARSELDEIAAGAFPSSLDDGLPAALTTLAIAAPIGATVDIEIADDAELDAQTVRTLYFVAAEALTNAIKHSGGIAVDIRLVAQPARGVELLVVDNGVGGITLRPGGGLAGLTDRVAALGGTLCCEGNQGGGSSVNAWLPLPASSGQSRRSQSGTVIRSL